MIIIYYQRILFKHLYENESNKENDIHRWLLVFGVDKLQLINNIIRAKTKDYKFNIYICHYY